MQIDKIRSHQTDQLFKAILELKDLDECYHFFDDLFTIGELQSLAQRLEVARMLKLKKRTTPFNMKRERALQRSPGSAVASTMARAATAKCWRVCTRNWKTKRGFGMMENRRGASAPPVFHGVFANLRQCR